MTIERFPITSSNIASIGYDPVTQVLEIEFNNGAVWQYADVPQEEWEAFNSAFSKGSHFAFYIKDVYKETKIQDARPKKKK